MILRLAIILFPQRIYLEKPASEVVILANSEVAKRGFVVLFYPTGGFADEVLPALICIYV
jgi:hypothetical protein